MLQQQIGICSNTLHVYQLVAWWPNPNEDHLCMNTIWQGSGSGGEVEFDADNKAMTSQTQAHEPCWPLRRQETSLTLRLGTWNHIYVSNSEPRAGLSGRATKDLWMNQPCHSLLHTDKFILHPKITVHWYEKYYYYNYDCSPGVQIVLSSNPIAVWGRILLIAVWGRILGIAVWGRILSIAVWGRILGI